MLFFYIFLVMNCLKYKSTIPQWFVRLNVVLTFYFKQQFCTVKDLKRPLKIIYLDIHALSCRYTAKSSFRIFPKNDAYLVTVV